jgi:hypothetical protein
MVIEPGDNAVREQQAVYAAVGARQDHALIRELWAIEGHSDRFHVQRIAERSGLPVKWLSTPPRINGDRGMDKLLAELSFCFVIARARSSSSFSIRWEGARSSIN